MAGALVAIHAVAALAMLLVVAGAAGAGVLDFRHGGRLSRRYDRVLWDVQALLLVQVAAGIGALLLGRSPASPWHIAFGSAASLLPWGGWLLVRHRRRVSLDMALVCLLVIVAGAAAIGTAA